MQGKVLSTIADGPFKVNRTEQYAVDYPVAVVDHTPGVRDWVWQVATDKQGHPVIAMVKISGDKKKHDYYYTYWDGQAWKKSSWRMAEGISTRHRISNVVTAAAWP